MAQGKFKLKKSSSTKKKQHAYKNQASTSKTKRGQSKFSVTSLTKSDGMVGRGTMALSNRLTTQQFFFAFFFPFRFSSLQNYKCIVITLGQLYER